MRAGEYQKEETDTKLFSVRSIAARLSLGFGVILALLLGMVLVQMQAMSLTLEQITVHNAARVQTLDVMGRNVSRYVQALGDLGSTDLEGGAAMLTHARSILVDCDKAKLLPADARAQALLLQVQSSAKAARELLALARWLLRDTTAAVQAAVQATHRMARQALSTPPPGRDWRPAAGAGGHAP